MTTKFQMDKTEYLMDLIESYEFFIKNENKEGTLLNTNSNLKPLIKEELFKCTCQLFKLKEIDTELIPPMMNYLASR